MYDFKPQLRDTALTQPTYSALFFKYNAPEISEMTRQTSSVELLVYFLKIVTEKENKTLQIAFKSEKMY